MRCRTLNLSAGLLALSLSGGVVAQEYVGPVGGTPVDRNVGDSGPNSASQRLMQPGLGQFGVGSLLLDRFDNKPHQFDRFNPIVGDSRTSHRYLMQAPGVTALMSRPDYIGPSPRGGWVFNQQTFDGAEILTFSPDTVFVLSPDLLAAPRRNDELDASLVNHPNRLTPTSAGDPNAIMRDTLITGKPRNYVIDNHPAVQNDPNYVHPEIIERRKRLKAEREAEEAAKAKVDEPRSHEVKTEEKDKD
ncbi:MAG: hypothetical protein AB8C95_15685 [Phycisphaeraceae bacterium]